MEGMNTESEYARAQIRLVVDTLNATMNKRPRPQETGDGGSMEPLCGMMHEWEHFLSTDWESFKEFHSEVSL